ncbi:MAG: hypothetical protein PHV30_02595 [Candidatus Margulisbacteria bacterium]|nr:hypothetical protein [Candidatus Margulisiibacteriota bacterium]
MFNKIIAMTDEMLLDAVNKLMNWTNRYFYTKDRISFILLKESKNLAIEVYKNGNREGGTALVSLRTAKNLLEELKDKIEPFTGGHHHEEDAAEIYLQNMIEKANTRDDASIEEVEALMKWVDRHYYARGQINFILLKDSGCLVIQIPKTTYKEGGAVVVSLSDAKSLLEELKKGLESIDGHHKEDMYTEFNLQWLLENALKYNITIPA